MSASEAYLFNGAQVGTKSCRLHAVDPAVRRLVAVACQLTLKDFCHFAKAVNLICGCFGLADFLEIVNVKMSVPCLHQADTYAGTTI